MKRNCLDCGKEFEAQDREVKRGNGKFCSLRCSAKYLGRQRSESKPLNVKCSYCGKMFHKPNSRLEQSDFHFCCRKHKDLAQKNWVGVPDFYGTGKNYRKIALSNKPMRCERCGYDKHPAGIVIHHKDRNRDNNELENLEVLCCICHAIEHYSPVEL